jgi:hypothetical protein
MYLRLCLVDGVDELRRTVACTPVDGGAALTDVNLQATESQTAGAVVIPRQGSYVAVGYYDRNNAVVILTDEIDKIAVDARETIIFNGGQNNGMVKVDAMVGWMAKVHSDLQTLKALLMATPVAGNGAPLALAFNPQTPAPQTGDFENDKIKH